MVAPSDLTVWDIVEIDLSTYNRYKWHAKVLQISPGGGDKFPIRVKYLQTFIDSNGTDLLWKGIWIRLDEIKAIESVVLEKIGKLGFTFIKI